MLDKTEDICFVIMPFSDNKLNKIYEMFIKKAIENNFSLQCIRSDSLYSSTPIMRDIWKKINTSKFIIADLTNRNPNRLVRLLK